MNKDNVFLKEEDLKDLEESLILSNIRLRIGIVLM
jgi:hypothetical protein